MARAVANVFSLAKDKSTVLLSLNYHNGSKANLVTVSFALGKKKKPKTKGVDSKRSGLKTRQP